jgi:coenzyme F420-dependent glucose-6-phosphate dehydrogenase
LTTAQLTQGGRPGLRIGYKASAEQFGPRELLELARLAERLGYDSVFVSDHFQPWRHHGGHAPFSLAWIAAAGASTSRISIGTSVLTPTFRYQPAIIAQAFATLGALFPGRIILGMGTGESMNEIPATGLAWPEPRERTRRFREALELIRRLWSQERVTFEGEYYRTDRATIYDRPAEPVPIYIAAAGPVVAKLAGEQASGFICTSGKGAELYRDTLLPAVAAGLAEAHRGEDSLDRMIEMKVSFDTDAERALEDTRFWGALALSAQEKVDVQDPLDMERLADALPIERVATRWIVSSDPEAQIEQIAPYIEMGFKHLVLHAPGPDQARFLELYAQQVVPLLRKRFA